jgi:hypothetical protein
MLRNFGILNRMLCLPTRSDPYRADPLDVSRTNRAMSRSGKASSSPALEQINLMMTLYFQSYRMKPPSDVDENGRLPTSLLTRGE